MNAYSWKDLYVGLSAEFQAFFTSKMAESFSRLSGDINPLHLDAAYAASKGFAAPVLYGMLTSSLYSRLAGVYLPGEGCLLQGMDLHFHSPCFAGDQLTVRGKIVFLLDNPQRIEIKATIRNAEDRLISKALIRAGLYE